MGKDGENGNSIKLANIQLITSQPEMDKDEGWGYTA
jgi:hypothetical protein